MSENLYGFVYLWYDKWQKMYYIGCHWGTADDGYICSSSRMRKAYRRRPDDFKRRILKTRIPNRKQLLIEEFYYLSMIKKEELGKKYYNLRNHHFDHWVTDPNALLTIGEKISANRKGKYTGYRDPSIGEAISLAKKGKALTPKHIEALKAVERKKYSEERKKEISRKVAEMWENGSINRKRKEIKSKKAEEEISQTRSDSIKSKWSDSDWKEKQIERLKEGAQKRDKNSYYKGKRDKVIKYPKDRKKPERVQCPHCLKMGAGGSMIRNHFENCKSINTIKNI